MKSIEGIKVHFTLPKSPTFWWILNIITILTLFGLINLYFTSSFYNWSNGLDSFFLVRRQTIWLVIGFLIFFFLATLDYTYWRKVVFWLFIMTGSGLVLTLLINNGEQDYFRRALFSGSVRLSQVAQVVGCLLSADFLADRTISVGDRLSKSLWFYFAGFLFLSGLIIMQPDFSEAILLITIAIFGLYLAGLRFRYLLIFGGVASLGFLILMQASGYGIFRWKDFLDGLLDPGFASYHVQMALVYVSQGGFLGQGFGANNFASLPLAATDSAFVTIISNVGCFGAFLLMVLYGTVIFLGFKASIHSTTSYGRLLAGTLSFAFATRTIMHIISLLGLAPITGIELPLVSYGGSNIVVTMVEMGILVNISGDQAERTIKQ